MERLFKIAFFTFLTSTVCFADNLTGQFCVPAMAGVLVMDFER